MRESLKSSGVRWLRYWRSSGCSHWSRSAAVDARTWTFSGLSSKFDVLKMSAPHTLGTARMSKWASSST